MIRNTYGLVTSRPSFLLGASFRWLLTTDIALGSQLARVESEVNFSVALACSVNDDHETVHQIIIRFHFEFDFATQPLNSHQQTRLDGKNQPFTSTMNTMTPASQTLPSTSSSQLLEAYHDWCKASGTPEPIQSRTITSKFSMRLIPSPRSFHMDGILHRFMLTRLAERIESYIGYCVEQLAPDEMSWRDLKSLSRGLKAMVVEQLGWESDSATLALFDIKLKNQCWKLSTKHNIESSCGKALQINCDLDEIGELRHSVEEQSSQDSYDGHASQMGMFKLMGISSKLKLADLIKKPESELEIGRPTDCI
jgi:hypothetical protein